MKFIGEEHKDASEFLGVIFDSIIHKPCIVSLTLHRLFIFTLFLVTVQWKNEETGENMIKRVKIDDGVIPMDHFHQTFPGYRLHYNRDKPFMMQTGVAISHCHKTTYSQGK